TILPEKTNAVFFDFWRERKARTPLEKLQLTFLNIEKFLFQSSFDQAESERDEFEAILHSLSLKEAEVYQLIEIRRVLSKMLLQEISLQNEEWFKTYALLVQKEREFFETQEEEQEDANTFKREVAHEILSFLQKFLEDRTKIDVSEVILSVYRNLHMDELADREGQDIFTPEENELIHLISLIGNTGLTKEELDAIKLARESQTELSERISELEAQTKQDTADTSANEREITSIANAKYLKDLFQKNGIITAQMDFETIREQGITRFSKGEFQGLPVSGVFQYTTQLFERVEVGETSTEQIHERFLNGFLNQIENSLAQKQSDTSDNASGNGIFISQTTPQAILQRKFIQELLTAEEVTVSRQNIQILDMEMQRFHVSNAEIQKHKIEFIYDRETHKAYNTSLQVGATTLLLGGEGISFEDILTRIEEEEAKEQKKER
ncbi:hypothetical protein K9L63_03645, partial [Candidatus Gracilibacteria bacterium]|nr:hypothetical protein [Candidatus Gracilibacteria bacterium]